MWTPEKVKAEPLEARKAIYNYFNPGYRIVRHPEFPNKLTAFLRGWDEGGSIYIPDYESDANLLPELLAKLTDEQRARYKSKLWWLFEEHESPCFEDWLEFVCTHADRIACLLNVLEESK